MSSNQRASVKISWRARTGYCCRAQQIFIRQYKEWGREEIYGSALPEVGEIQGVHWANMLLYFYSCCPSELRLILYSAQISPPPLPHCCPLGHVYLCHNKSLQVVWHSECGSTVHIIDDRAQRNTILNGYAS